MIVDFYSHKVQDILIKISEIKSHAEYLKDCNEKRLLELGKSYSEKIFNLSKEIIDIISNEWKIEVEINVKEK